ncbi:unnamed protein product [Rotaria socialis]|uniref:Uncharacterized protein n=2 Tax=Rotaria socialis TaxID=392032 RepID=A0A818THH8_9BILA|nr:unnamed protein product [Rotaria socialis]
MEISALYIVHSKYEISKKFQPLVEPWDWGSLIGLQLVGINGIDNRFARVVVGNGGLPIGDTKFSDAFITWQKFASEQAKIDVGFVITHGVKRKMKFEELTAYNAPFRNEKYQAGALIFPQLVPTRHDDPSSRYNLGVDKLQQMMILGAKNQPHATVTQAGHYLQEDKPHEIVEHLIKFIENNPLPSK